jgi:hypothetical protein
MTGHLEEAARADARVALVTCADLPDLEADDRLLIAPLGGLGLRAEPVIWDDPAVDWSAYALVVIRSPWDYTRRRDEFVAWAARVPSLANPADVIAWNTDKRYLRELADAGVPVVPTDWVAPGDPWAASADGQFVVKPSISVGSQDTGRYDAADAGHRRLAEEHVARLQASGRLAMTQPYLPAVDTYGETALVFHGGPLADGPGGPVFSHAVRKGPMLDGPDVPDAALYRPEQITPRTPTAAEHATAARVLAAVPGGPNRLVYARVDLIPGPDGEPLLVELEVTEPSLFLSTAAQAPVRFARAIAAAVRSSRPSGPR